MFAANGAKRVSEEPNREQDAQTAAGDDTEMQLRRGIALHQRGYLDQAARIYDEVLAADPQQPDALHLLGAVDAQRGRYEPAIERIRAAIALAPRQAQYWNNLGIALQGKGEIAEAEAAYQRSLELDPDSPDALNNLGNVYARQGRLEEALASYQAALVRGPKHPDALCNVGLLLRDLGRHQDSLMAFQRAVRLAPHFADAHLHYATALLLTGALDEGWRGYEWRWRTRRLAERRRHFVQPRWSGGYLSGKRLLIWGEQGIAEQVLFASLLQDIAGLDGEVAVECAPPLVPLLARSFADFDIRPQPEPVEGGQPENQDFDFQIPMGSLCRYFRRGLADLPSGTGYLVADGERVAALRRRYREQAGGAGPGSDDLLIGIVWRRDDAPQRGAGDVPLAAWLPILKQPGCRFLNLQQGGLTQEVTAVQRSGATPIESDPEIDASRDLDAYAAQLAAVDLVITVGGSTAHLASALGLAPWVLVPVAPSWCWGLEGDSTPWYPASRLFRQERPGDWVSVIARVAQALKRRLRERRTGP